MIEFMTFTDLESYEDDYIASTFNHNPLLVVPYMERNEMYIYANGVLIDSEYRVNREEGFAQLKNQLSCIYQKLDKVTGGKSDQIYLHLYRFRSEVFQRDRFFIFYTDFVCSKASMGAFDISYMFKLLNDIIPFCEGPIVPIRSTVCKPSGVALSNSIRNFTAIGYDGGLIIPFSETRKVYKGRVNC